MKTDEEEKMQIKKDMSRNWRMLSSCLLIFMMAAMPGCSETPTSPPAEPPPEAQPEDVPVDQGQVTIYAGINYSGEGYTLRGSIADLRDLPGPCGLGNWDDCISSIRVSPGWRATLFDGDQFENDDVVLTQDVPDLGEVIDTDGILAGDWDNVASSIMVEYLGASR